MTRSSSGRGGRRAELLGPVSGTRVDSAAGEQWTLVLFFCFKQKTAYEILAVTGVQTCALPICTHTCVVTSREPAGPGYEPEGGGARRPWVTELLSSLPVTHGVLNVVLDLDPDGTPEAMDDALERLADREYTDRSYRVFNIGAANLLPAYSSEIGVELAGDVPVRAVERIFAVAAKHARLGAVYATAP